MFNIQKLQKVRWKQMPPMTKMRLSLRPRFQSRHTADNIDTASGIPKVENSWLDVASLVMSSGQAPDVKTMNGFLLCVKDTKDRTLVVHET